MFLKEIYRFTMRNIIVQVLLTSLKAMRKKGKANPVHLPLNRKYKSILLKFLLVYSFLRKKVCISRWLLSIAINLVEFTNCLMSTMFNEYSLKRYGYFLHPFSTTAVLSTCSRCFQPFSAKCKSTSWVIELSMPILADTALKRLMS